MPTFPGADTTGPTLTVTGLTTSFFTADGVVNAVDDVSFTVGRGKVLGIVGESGSGKTMTAFSIINLLDHPGRIVGGSILFQDRELVGMSEKALRQLRGDRIATIFQDPMMTLNPVLRIDTQMIEAVREHHDVSRSEARTKARDALVRVGIAGPDRRLKSYPHELSGGMRQRVTIAIALINDPDLIIADEPTTALDVTIQGQILFEVQQLVRRTGTSLIWITHDLSVVAGFADDIAIMYAGRVVEQGSVEAVLDHPLHPYTQALIECLPNVNKKGRRLSQIDGMAPSLKDLPSGCAFRPRCHRGDDLCRTDPGETRSDDGRWFRCHHPVRASETVS